MTLEFIQSEMIAAMKNKDKARKDVLASLVAAIKNQAIKDGNKEVFDEVMIEEVILKEKKTIQEQIDTCPDSRKDLLAKFTVAMSVINEFAPVMMTRNEVKAEIIKICQEEEISFEAQNRGRIMRATLGRGLKRKAGGETINAVVTELLK